MFLTFVGAVVNTASLTSEETTPTRMISVTAAVFSGDAKNGPSKFTVHCLLSGPRWTNFKFPLNGRVVQISGPLICLYEKNGVSMTFQLGGTRPSGCSTTLLRSVHIA